MVHVDFFTFFQRLLAGSLAEALSRAWYSDAVSIALALICLVSVLSLAPSRALAVEYSLQVGNLIDDAFSYYIRGNVGRGEGELLLPHLERALDAATVSRGALLYDRDIYPAGEGVARSFGAAPVRPVGQSATRDRGSWKTVRWEGKPGERVIWVVRPATIHLGKISHLALAGTAGGLRYYVPYSVTLSPTPAATVSYSLSFLRSGEDGTVLWERHLSRAVDLRGGLAAVVGVNTVGGDWVYLVVEQPPAPVTFSSVLGWARRGSGSDIQAGTGGGIRLK